MTAFIQWVLGLPAAEMARADSWRLTFVADYSNYAIVALIAAFLALVYLTVRSYRREGDAPTAAKAVLIVLRVLVFAAVVLMLFRPAIELRFVETLLSKVVVLVDDSRSMSFADRYASGKDGDALAAFLKTDRAALASLSRSRIVREALVRPDSVLTRLGQTHPLVLMRFSTAQPGKETYTRKLIELPARRGQAPAAATMPAELSKALSQLQADGYETNIPASIRDALDSTRGQQVAAIVVISDGQITAEGAAGRLGAAVESANRRVGGAVPLYAVSVGDPKPPRNVTVTALQGPNEVRRGTRAELSAVLSHRNLAGTTVMLRVLRREAGKANWTDTQVRQSVTLKAPPAESAVAAEVRQTVELFVEPDALGQFVYKAVVDPVADEANPDDNSAEARVQVSDEKVKVLVIAGDAGWDFQYLRNLLLRAGDSYRVSIWQQNADKDINQAASTGMKLSQLPRTLEELIGSPGGKPHPGYDAIILHDPQPGEGGFDSALVKMLRDFVEKHGGGLCYIAGGKYSHQALSGEGAMKDLADIMPVVLAPNTADIAVRMGTRKPEAWPLKVTSYGADHPMMRLAATAEQSGQVWSVLPGVYWSHPVARVKPAGKVLAESANPMDRTGRNEPLPIVAVQPFGAGRAVYVGTDETWRWRFVQEGYYHRRFWGELVRYLATLKARQVVITTGGDRFTAGQKISVEVEAYDEKFEALKDPSFTVTLRKITGEAVEKITLKPLDAANKPGRYSGILEAKHTGTYDLTALDSDPQAALKVAPKRIVIELPQAESRRPEADVDTMKNVASRAEQYLPIEQIDRLSELIAPGMIRTVKLQPHFLWDTPAMLILVVVLLAVEWILRKKYNMA
ncbi:MAG: vWA domain-containing protein [Planctomycetaceae bacterium]|nr:VWA domain-containing protein [Planctomycetaceae bacterium]